MQCTWWRVEGLWQTIAYAEKYAIGRLKIKLRNETISFNESWWVNMYINKPPCNGYRPCVATIEEFASKYPNIKITVKYTGNVEEINTDSLQNLRIAPFNVMNWKFLIGRIIKLKRDQHSDDIKLMARLRGIWKAIIAVSYTHLTLPTIYSV